MEAYLHYEIKEKMAIVMFSSYNSDFFLAITSLNRTILTFFLRIRCYGININSHLYEINSQF